MCLASRSPALSPSAGSDREGSDVGVGGGNRTRNAALFVPLIVGGSHDVDDDRGGGCEPEFSLARAMKDSTYHHAFPVGLLSVLLHVAFAAAASCLAATTDPKKSRSLRSATIVLYVLMKASLVVYLMEVSLWRWVRDSEDWSGHRAAVVSADVIVSTCMGCMLLVESVWHAGGVCRDTVAKQ
jgi:hypothetical protein